MPPEEQCEDWSSPARYWRPSSQRHSAVAAAPTPCNAADRFRAGNGGAPVPAGRALPDGSIDGSLGETADFVIGARPRATIRPLCSAARGTTALDYLAIASDKATDAGNTGKAILAVVAAGGNPASFKGRDLTARLAALYHSATGAVWRRHDVQPVVRHPGGGGIGRHRARGGEDALKALQDPDGSWSYGSVAVPAGQGDSQLHGHRADGSRRGGSTHRRGGPRKYLATQQVGDGGFAYSTAWGSTSDPDSDSIVLQALVAAGQDPEGAGWLQGANSVLTDLRVSQAASGGFAYPGGAPDALTTSQVPAALVRIPYAGAVRWTPGRSLPAIECPSPTQSPTPTPTPTATPSPSPSPTAVPTPSPTPTAAPTPRPTVRPTVKPAVKPLATVAVASTVPPTENPAPTDTAAPTASQTRTDDIAAVDASATHEQVAAVTLTPGSSSPPPSDPSVPTPLLYVAVAALGLAVVLGGGWLYVNRPWIR
jgi:hypothetical protein